jgi:hypothetical protein
MRVSCAPKRIAHLSRLCLMPLPDGRGRCALRKAERELLLFQNIDDVHMRPRIVRRQFGLQSRGSGFDTVKNINSR